MHCPSFSVMDVSPSSVTIDLIDIQGQVIFWRFGKYYPGLQNRKLRMFKHFTSCTSIMLDSPVLTSRAPSIPGFGFSDNPDRPGFGYPQIAEAFNNLMLSLGYTNYVAQGGDIGSFLSIRLGQRHPESCRAVLVNMLVARPPTLLQDPVSWLKWVTFPSLFYSKVEMENLARTAWFFKGEVGYQVWSRTNQQG
jgi:pimeloyl-ACP methyl ester carboxylesterase